ncbi:MAG: AfsR/SARP family transcriptional regulator [Acidimicrobiia bacterium]
MKAEITVESLPDGSGALTIEVELPDLRAVLFPPATSQLVFRVAGPPAPRVEPPTATTAARPIRRNAVEVPRPDRIQLRCLGTFEFAIDGHPIDLSTLKPRVRELLWLLSIHGGRRVHAEQIAESLWPESDQQSGKRNLQVAVSMLRRLLEPDHKRVDWRVLVREGSSYRLELDDGDDVDVREFQRAVAEGRVHRRAGRDDAALVAYEQALSCCSGVLIPEAGPAEWIVLPRETRLLEATEAAAAAAELRLQRGDTAAGIAHCRRGLELDRYRDVLWRLLIGAYDAAGNHAAAAQARNGYQVVLDDLGVPDQSAGNSVKTSSDGMSRSY